MALSLSLRRLGLSIRQTHTGASVNIFKDPSLALIEKPDAEYPPWLWRLLDPPATKEELLRDINKLYQSGGYDEVFADTPEKDLIRLFRLQKREQIKEHNGRRRGGRIV